MGMFDSVFIKMKCPHCGEEAEREAQTKDTDCVLNVWRKGSRISTDKYTYLDCIVSCSCGEFFYCKVMLDKGEVTGEYETV